MTRRLSRVVTRRRLSALAHPARVTLWASVALCTVAVVALPVFLGVPSLSGIGLVVVIGQLLSLRLEETKPASFRPAVHAVDGAAFVAVLYAVFWLGFSPVVTVYFGTLLLLKTAHVLGARATLFWAAPCVALVVTVAWVPLPEPREVGPTVTLLVRMLTVLTVAVYAFSFRRAHDRQTAALERQATTDALTGLANRHALMQAIDLALLRADRYGRRGAVVFVDVDQMKAINDRYGHAVGDSVLKTLATRMASMTRQVDATARLGGDEFVVVLSEFDDPVGAEVLARNLLARLREPVTIEHDRWCCTCSIGIAVFPDCGVTAPDILDLADRAMYRAKHAGGDRIVIHDRHGTRPVAEASPPVGQPSAT